MSSQLDVVMTATRRPELIALTLKSFHRRLLQQFDKTRLILNIDPMGQGSTDAVISVAKQYFNTIVINTPKVPNFAKAVYWCWQQVESPYFLHLEDDWLLVKPIHKHNIETLFHLHENLASVRLYLSSNAKLATRSNLVLSNGLSLNPSFIRREFLDYVLPRFDCTQDPEKQFKDLRTSNHWDFAVLGDVNSGRFVIDMGTKWRKYHQLKKPHNVEGLPESWEKTQVPVWTRLYSAINYYFYMMYWGVRSRV